MFKNFKNSPFCIVFFLSLTFAGSLILGTLALADEERKAPQMSVEEVKTLIENLPADYVIMDVRTPKEYDHGALPHAILVDFYEEDFADNVAKLDKSKTYVLYCRTGIRGGKAQALMQEQGFSKVYNMTGGFNAFYPENAYELDSLK